MFFKSQVKIVISIVINISMVDLWTPIHRDNFPQISVMIFAICHCNLILQSFYLRVTYGHMKW